MWNCPSPISRIPKERKSPGIVIPIWSYSVIKFRVFFTKLHLRQKKKGKQKESINKRNTFENKIKKLNLHIFLNFNFRMLLNYEWNKNTFHSSIAYKYNVLFN